MTTWLSPGDPDRPTGGYRYNARITAALGHRVLPLPGRWPEPDPADIDRCGPLLAAIPDGEPVVLDGLALAAALPWLPALKACGCRVVLLIHLPLSAEHGLSPEVADRLSALEQRAAALADRVVATSDHAARWISALHGCPVQAIPPGCPPLPPATVTGAGRLLCVGSVTPRKGHDVLLSALARLGELDWTLRCAGEVSPWGRSLPWTDRTRLLGPLDTAQVHAAYAASDVFVLATWAETYGMALAEAAAAGLPIVSTTAGAVPQTVPPGAGLLVPPGDPGALADALRAVLTDPQRRGAMAYAARRAPRQTWADAATAWRTLEETLR